GFARLRVEGAERLVHEQHLGIDGKSAGNADALLHPAGELVGAAVERVGEPDELEIAGRGGAQLRPAHALHFESEHHVLQGGEPGQELGELKHHAAVVAAALHLAPIHCDFSAGRGFEPHGNAQRRRLAATRGTDERDDLAVVHFETHAAERLHGMHRPVDAQREPLRYIVEGDLTHAADHLSTWHQWEQVTTYPDTAHLPARSIACARISVLTILARSPALGIWPSSTICPCIQASLSMGSGSSGAIAPTFTASSKTKAGRGSSGLASVASAVSSMVSSRCERA